MRQLLIVQSNDQLSYLSGRAGRGRLSLPAARSATALGRGASRITGCRICTPTWFPPRLQPAHLHLNQPSVPLHVVLVFRADPRVQLFAPLERDRRFFLERDSFPS